MFDPKKLTRPTAIKRQTRTKSSACFRRIRVVPSPDHDRFFAKTAAHLCRRPPSISAHSQKPVAANRPNGFPEPSYFLWLSTSAALCLQPVFAASAPPLHTMPLAQGISKNHVKVPVLAPAPTQKSVRGSLNHPKEPLV